MGLSHPLDGKSDRELLDYLTFYLDCHAFHQGMARNSSEHPKTKALHEFRAEFCARRARAIEAVVKERRRVETARIKAELARVGIGLSVYSN